MPKKTTYGVWNLQRSGQRCPNCGGIISEPSYAPCEDLSLPEWVDVGSHQPFDCIRELKGAIHDLKTELREKVGG